MTADRFFILTGGPGSGKTTLLDALERAGFDRTSDAARGIIQDQTAIDGPAQQSRDPMLFAELILSWEIRSYRAAETLEGIVLFDRGIPDLVGYYSLFNIPLPEHVMKAVETFRYNRRVLVAPPWPEIFTQDRERTQTLDWARRCHQVLIETYPKLGYELVELPRVSVEERVQFVTRVVSEDE